MIDQTHPSRAKALFYRFFPADRRHPSESGEADPGSGDRSPSRLLPWLIMLLLLVLPLATYWDTTFHDYGFRDDYANLRESHEEPGKILAFTASHARPLYGWLLQHSFEQVDSIRELAWLRLTGTLGLGVIAILLFRLLRRLGWGLAAAAFTSAMVSLVPSAQVIAGWATAWPYTVAAILSLSAFVVMTPAKRPPGRLRWLLAWLLMVFSALTYQPNCLFYVIGLAASLPFRRELGLHLNLRWLGRHLGLAFASLATAFLIMKGLYFWDVFDPSNRVAFEHDPLGKLWWFLEEPLLNAINLFVLNDNEGATWMAYTAGAVLTGLLLAVGLHLEWRKPHPGSGLFWLVLLALLPIAAYSVNLVAAERYASYRTIFTLTAVILIFLTLSWSNLCALAGRSRRLVEWSGYALFLALAVHTAQIHAYSLIALPQSQELETIRQAADPLKPRQKTLKIYFMQLDPEDNPTEISYNDEFGSLSTSGAEWISQEMLKHILREHFPKLSSQHRRFEMRVGLEPPPKGEKFDLVIDMRKLRTLGPLYAESGSQKTVVK